MCNPNHPCKTTYPILGNYDIFCNGNTNIHINVFKKNFGTHFF